MTLASALKRFAEDAAQCDRLIVNAHQADATGVPVLPTADRHQITAAAFLNLFLAWEEFLEATMTMLMAGETTILGSTPTRYVSPPSIEKARELIAGTNRYFDYSNHEYVRKMAYIYFKDAYPFEPHLSSIFQDLADLKTIRNSCAHKTSSTKTSLEAVAQRIFSTPKPGISVYAFLTAIHPQSSSGGTVFVEYSSKLLAAAEQIASG